MLLQIAISAVKPPTGFCEGKVMDSNFRDVTLNPKDEEERARGGEGGRGRLL